MVAAARACGGGLDVVDAMVMPVSFLTWLVGGALELNAAAQGAAAALPAAAAGSSRETGIRRISLGNGDETLDEALAKLGTFLSAKAVR